jgi:hypothetical protein
MVIHLENLDPQMISVAELTKVYGRYNELVHSIHGDTFMVYKPRLQGSHHIANQPDSLQKMDQILCW